MEFLIALLTGGLAGLHASTWGMYKDSPHEGFSWGRYFRSAIFGLIYGPVIWYVSGNEIDVTTSTGIVLLWGATYVAERLTLEVWKTFLRTQDQSKYFIPMQLHVMGKVVESKPARFAAAAAYVGGIALIGWGLYSIWQWHQAGNFDINPFLILLPLSVGGWISAFGGAWKDAPLEGFQIFKFFRSPGIAYFFAFLAALLTDNFLLITLCSIGYTVASIETHKTFFFPSIPRGKFQGKPILFPDMLKKRQKFIPIYVGIWLYVIINAVIAFMSENDSLI